MKHSEILIIQKNTGHDAREKKKTRDEKRRGNWDKQRKYAYAVCMYANPNSENVGTCWEN